MGTLKGQIIDEKNLLPIKDTTLILKRTNLLNQDDLVQTSNYKGYFLWNELESGDYNLEVYAGGYKKKSIHFSILYLEVLELVIRIKK